MLRHKLDLAQKPESGEKGHGASEASGAVRAGHPGIREEHEGGHGALGRVLVLLGTLLLGLAALGQLRRLLLPLLRWLGGRLGLLGWRPAAALVVRRRSLLRFRFELELRPACKREHLASRQHQ